MNRTAKSDLERLNPLVELGSRVVTVSESNVVDNGEHFPVDFKIPRGWKRLTQWVHDQVVLGFVVDLFLDYFFLLNVYWSERYNIDWLSYKIPAIIAAGARCIIVPRTAAMLTMEAQVCYRGILTQFHEHPLWLATEISGVLSSRGEHSTHMERLVQNGPFMMYNADCIPAEFGLERMFSKAGHFEAIAGKFGAQIRDGIKGYDYQIWWKNGSVTWEPKSNLKGISKKFMDKMHSQRGKKVKFTGVVDVETVTDIPSVLFLWEQAGRGGIDVNVIHQKPGSHCALNSVANGIYVPAIFYDALYKTDPSLEEVVDSLSGKVGRLTKVGENSQDLLAWLFRQREGVFAVEYGTHCFTWDCDRQLLMDTDPRLPYPLPAIPDAITHMGFSSLTKAYRLWPNPIPTKKPSRNERRRKAIAASCQNERPMKKSGTRGIM